MNVIQIYEDFAYANLIYKEYCHLGGTSTLGIFGTKIPLKQSRTIQREVKQFGDQLH